MPVDEVEESVTNGLRWGLAREAAKGIGNKGKYEIFQILDYWYSLEERKTREEFAENINAYNETYHLITPQRMEWVMEWSETVSPKVRKAMENKELRFSIFEGDADKMRQYIQYCETADNPTAMAKAAVTMEIPIDYRNKRLYDVLKCIGFDVGNYNNWKNATRRAANQ